MAKAKNGNGQDGTEPKLGIRIKNPATKDNQIRNWRLFKGVAMQRDLAKLTALHDPKRKGIPRVTICRLETGEQQYSEWHLALISKALGVSRGDLIDTNPYDAGDIFAVYAVLSDADKRKALKLLAKLKS